MSRLPASVADCLSPIRPFLEDPTVTDIFVNGPSEVLVDRAGEGRRRVDVRFSSARQLEAVLEYLAREAGGAHGGHLSAELPGGDRVHAILGLSHRGEGPFIAIRRHARVHLDGRTLVLEGAVSAEGWSHIVESLVHRRENVLFAGPTGSGKTACAEAALREVGPEERLMLLQDVEEILPPEAGHQWLSFRPGPAGYEALLASVLRMQPDRIALGECRGAEAWTLLEALTTGHSGGVSTIHAGSPRAALRRLESLSLTHPHAPDLRAIRARVADAIQLVVQLDRTHVAPVRRYVSEIAEVLGVDDAGNHTLRTVFVHKERPPRHR